MPEKFELSWEHIRGLLLTHGLRILLILVVAFLAYRVVKLIIRRIQVAVEDEDPATQSEAEKRAETLGRVVRQISLVAIVAASAMGILKELGFEIGPLIAGAGIVGLAVGFGAQNLVRDVITGFFIIFENQLRVGDIVEVGGKSGVVEAVNLRTTVLRDVQGRVHVVPNGVIDIVTNLTREWSRVVLDVGVAYKEDIGRVVEVLKEIGTEFEQDGNWKHRIIEPMTIAGVEALGASSVEVRVMLKVFPGAQFDAGRELRRRIKDRFDREGIEIPFPHTTLYVRSGQPATLPEPITEKDR